MLQYSQCYAYHFFNNCCKGGQIGCTLGVSRDNCHSWSICSCYWSTKSIITMNFSKNLYIPPWTNARHILRPSHRLLMLKVARLFFKDYYILLVLTFVMYSPAIPTLSPILTALDFLELLCVGFPVSSTKVCVCLTNLGVL